MSTLHPNLPPLPERIERLPVDHRGYPVPWFVAWIDGKPDFRVVDPAKLKGAIENRLCWVCGGKLGTYLAFTIGPMCAINRVSAEPPSHRECAIFSAMACPFLTKPAVDRRVEGLPEDVRENPNHIRRNPGVALVWITKWYELMRNSDGSPLIHVGDPYETIWFALGKLANRQQVLDSMQSGLPLLSEACNLEPSRQLRDEAREALMERYHRALTLIPAI